MSRRRYHHWILRGGRSQASRLAKGRSRGVRQGLRRQPVVERLEERHVLSADPVGVALGDLATVWSAYDTTIYTSPPPPPPHVFDHGGGGSLMPTAPFELEQTFFLHSLPGATKTIYLDFDGHLTRDTPWNTGFNIPNILTPAFSMDENFAEFSDTELLVIQWIWERVAEDFRPFHVNVTTQDPGEEALRQFGEDDEHWGQRVAIGGSTADWYTPVTGNGVGGVAFGSFNWDMDVVTFAFAQDFVGGLGFPDKGIAEVISHEVGHTLGLAHDGQFRFWVDVTDPDDPEWHREWFEYYAGHGAGPTGWAPIMGVGYGQNLTQWSKSQYPNATNNQAGTSPLQDDLEIITTINGFDYRVDDHGSSIDTATVLEQDIEETMYFGEGIIERNTDVDFFSFTVEGLGEIVSFDIQPFYNGPNLDILAKLYNSAGVEIAMSNPIFELHASFIDVSLLPGTYYLSIEGTGRPVAYIDPLIPPAIVDPPDPFNPMNPMHLPPDTSDWGYSDYGSLGYYSIHGTRKKGLVVGVDFDASTGDSPLNWNLYSGGGPQTVLTNLISEAGATTPYQLSISTTGTEIETVASANPINPSDLPNHALPLDGLDGYLATGGETLTFVWSNLEPNSVYQVYVFGHADFEIGNSVHVVGGLWNAAVQTFEFSQFVSPDGLAVNDEQSPGGEALATLALLVVSTETGEITITVTHEMETLAALAGLAIAPTKFGTITGQKWNDSDGDGQKGPDEEGLPGWRIYLDLNNNGVLDVLTSPDQQIIQVAPNVPQALIDYSTVKNEVLVTEVGEIIDLDVTINISHTFVADLELFLISPAGTRVKLMDDLGGSGDNLVDTVFDDSATRSITSINLTEAPFTGRFRPMEPLSAFNGENSAGVWTLEIRDDAEGDIGVLNSWSMTFTLKGVDTFLEPVAVTDADGNYSFVNLLPGVYYVREHIQPQQQQAGWRQTWAPPPVTVRSGAHVMGIDFGNWIPVVQRGSIAGQKWNDLNGDGVKDPDEPGLGGWIVYMDANNNGVRDIATTPTTISATGLPKPITDFSTVTSQVTFDGLGTVFKVEVTLDITHSFMADLDAFLISPSGRIVELFTAVGGQFNDFQNLTLADDAPRSIGTIGFEDLPYTGRWRPEGFLSDFIGDDAAGAWTLVIRDTTLHDQGSLNSWSLTITAGELFTTTDEDGNYIFENLPAGQYVIREEQQSGWQQVTPANTAIPNPDEPAAVWQNSGWTVTINAVDNPSDPYGPDSRRNVKNVDFGNRLLGQLLPGDYNQDGLVDAADYVLWRRNLNVSTPPYEGADGNGSGMVDAGDYDVWRANFGSSAASGGGALAAGAEAEANEVVAASAAMPVVADFSAAAFSETDGSSMATQFDLDVEHAFESSFATAAGAVPRAWWSNPANSASDTRSGSHIRVRRLESFAATNDAGLLAWLNSRRDSAVRSSLASRSEQALVADGDESPASGEEFDELDRAFEALGVGAA